MPPKRKSGGSSGSRGSCHALKNYVRGSSWAMDAETDRQPGFSSQEDMSFWEENLLKPLVGTDLFLSACEVVKPGIMYYSDFSGYDAPRESLRVLCQYLQVHSDVLEQDVSVQCVRSCDCGRIQQDLLKQLSTLLDHGESCVFGNLDHRLPDWVAEWITTVAPTLNTEAAAAGKMNSDIHDFLLQHRGAVLDADSRSFCAVHKKACPVYPGCAFSRLDNTSSLASSEDAPTAWWEKPSRFQQKPLTVSAAGLCCTDYSKLGKQKREAGPSERWHHIWHIDRVRAAELHAEDFFFTECAHAYPADKQAAGLEDLYHVVHIKTSPHHLGFPVRRPRTFTAGISKESFVWIGPETDEELQEMWSNLFDRDCFLTGDVYFCASDEQVSAWVSERAAKRKKKLPMNWQRQTVEQLLPMVLPVGAVSRKRKYDDVFETGKALNGSFLCDLDHNPGYGPTAGPLFPPMDTHPSIYSYVHRRLALPLECFSAQGLDVFPALAGARGLTPLLPVLESLSDIDARFLAGNSLHVPSYICWMLFVFGHCRRRSELSKLPGRMTVPEQPDDDESEACHGASMTQASDDVPPRRRAVLRL